MSEEKMSSYSSMTLSIYCSHVGEPYFEVLAKIFSFPCEQFVRKINFLVWETILLRGFAVVKEMTGGGTTPGIMYKLFPKVITTARGLDSYTACVDQPLSLMSTQATAGANPILHGNFDLQN